MFGYRKSMKSVFAYILCLAIVFSYAQDVAARFEAPVLGETKTTNSTEAEQAAELFITEALSVHSPLNESAYESIEDPSLKQILVERANQVMLNRELAGYKKVVAEISLTKITEEQEGNTYYYSFESFEHVDFLPVHTGASIVCRYVLVVEGEGSSWQVTAAYAKDSYFYQFLADKFEDWQMLFLETSDCKATAQQLGAPISDLKAEEIVEIAKEAEDNMRNQYNTVFTIPKEEFQREEVGAQSLPIDRSAFRRYQRTWPYQTNE